MKELTSLIIFILISFSLNSQCKGNLIRNSGFELDTVSGSTTGKFWKAVDGTPDLDNSLDSFPSLGGGTWNQFPIDPSPNRGNWQNIGLTLATADTILNSQGDTVLIITADTLRESFGQHIRLQSSLPHILEFEYTAQIVGENRTNRSWHAAVDVLIDGKTVYTSPIDTTVFTWESASFEFIPVKQDIFISLYSAYVQKTLKLPTLNLFARHPCLLQKTRQ